MQPFTWVLTLLVDAGYHFWLYGCWLARELIIQIVILAMSAFVYFPFVKFQDKIAY